MNVCCGDFFWRNISIPCVRGRKRTKPSFAKITKSQGRRYWIFSIIGISITNPYITSDPLVRHRSSSIIWLEQLTSPKIKMCIKKGTTLKESSLPTIIFQRGFVNFPAGHSLVFGVFMLAPPRNPPFCVIYIAKCENVSEICIGWQKVMCGCRAVPIFEHVSDIRRWWSWSDVGSFFRRCMKRSVPSCFERGSEIKKGETCQKEGFGKSLCHWKRIGLRRSCLKREGL